MIDPVVLTIVMLGSLMLLMVLGMPLAFAMGTVAMITVVLLWGESGLDMLFYSVFGITHSFAMTAVPIFIFMGIVIERSGIGEELFDMVYRFLGGIRGGLGIGVIMICAVFAAMVGETGPATVTMGVVAVPIMLKRGYEKRMLTGVVQAGGTLGILIPPSISMIIYAFLANQSTGRMFAAGIIPGLLLAMFFIAYIFIRCLFQPQIGPSVPLEERYSWLERLKSLKAAVLPAVLIFIVLGLIIFGITSPTEAAGAGGAGALLIAAIHKTLSWKVLKESVFTTGRLMGMIMWIIVTAVVFSKIYHGLGAQQMLNNFISGYELAPMTVVILMLISYMFLGMFLAPSAISFLTIPLFAPVVIGLGFDGIWFGILYIISLEIGYLTPPFGFNLFYMKAIVPPEITMVDIYMSVIPFVGLQILGLVIVMIFPQIVLWLPNLAFGI